MSKLRVNWVSESFPPHNRFCFSKLCDEKNLPEGALTSANIVGATENFSQATPVVIYWAWYTPPGLNRAHCQIKVRPRSYLVWRPSSTLSFKFQSKIHSGLKFLGCHDLATIFWLDIFTILYSRPTEWIFFPHLYSLVSTYFHFLYNVIYNKENTEKGKLVHTWRQ